MVNLWVHALAKSAFSDVSLRGGVERAVHLPRDALRSVPTPSVRAIFKIRKLVNRSVKPSLNLTLVVW